MDASVHALCKQKGLSLLELTDRTGIDMVRLRSIFLGRWTPSPEERQKIAAALSVEVDAIAWGHVIPIQHIYGHGPT
jgi:transcriptional regulator with XRE-family HTH domain